jgi:hypothetical protein
MKQVEDMRKELQNILVTCNGSDCNGSVCNGSENNPTVCNEFCIKMLIGLSWVMIVVNAKQSYCCATTQDSLRM